MSWCHDIWHHVIWFHDIWPHDIWHHDIWRYDICLKNVPGPSLHNLSCAFIALPYICLYEKIDKGFVGQVLMDGNVYLGRRTDNYIWLVELAPSPENLFTRNNSLDLLHNCIPIKYLYPLLKLLSKRTLFKTCLQLALLHQTWYLWNIWYHIW